jgi:hypothetical protein
LFGIVLLWNSACNHKAVRVSASPTIGNTPGTPTTGGYVMFSEDRSDWRQLCKQAANETDFTRLMELTAEIVRLLDQQQEKSMLVGVMN